MPEEKSKIFKSGRLFFLDSLHCSLGCLCYRVIVSKSGIQVPVLQGMKETLRETLMVYQTVLPVHHGIIYEIGAVGCGADEDRPIARD